MAVAIWLMAGVSDFETLVMLAMGVTTSLIIDLASSVILPCLEVAGDVTWLEAVAVAITACMLMYCAAHACNYGGGGGGSRRRQH